MPTTTDVPRSLPEPVLDAFPTRPVVVRPARLPVGVALWVLGAVGLAVVTLVLSWRSLAPDHALGDDASVASVSGVEGSCHIRYSLLYTCDVTLGYVHDGQQRELDRHYLWVDPGSTDGYKDVLVSPDGTHATLSVAQDRFTNRVLTSAGIALVLLWLAGLGVRQVRRVLRLRSQYGATGGLELRPVPARLHKLVGKSRIGGPTPVFEVEVDGRRYRPVGPVPGSGSGPLTTASGAVVAIVPAAGPGEPMILDADLTGLELSEEERAAILEAAASS